MTIDEAIRLLQDVVFAKYDIEDADIIGLNKAKKLGIEALKRVKEYRSIILCEYGVLLPSETKEVR